LIKWLDNWFDDAAARSTHQQHPTDLVFKTAQQEAQRRFEMGQINEASQPFVDAFEHEELAENARQEVRSRARMQLLAEAVEWDKLALNGPAAAQKLRRIGIIKHPNDPDAQANYLFDQAAEFFSRGSTKGDNSALLLSISAYRLLLEIWTRDRVPFQWAMMQQRMGIALWCLGERESQIMRLEDAIAAFHAADEVVTFLRAPLEWARNHSNIASILMIIGAREGGTGRIVMAVAAFRVSLGEFAKHRQSIDWAMTQHNLGNALVRLGELEGGTRRLRIRWQISDPYTPHKPLGILYCWSVLEALI